MERFFAASQDSPLQMLRMLESNLKRERRIFAIAVGLLIFASVCVAAGTTAFLIGTTVKSEQVDVQMTVRSLNVAIFDHYATVTPGGLLLEVNANRLSAPSQKARAQSECAPYPSTVQDTVLSRSCEQAWHSPIDMSKPLPLQFALADRPASYGFNFFPDTDVPARAVEKLAVLVEAAKARISDYGIDILEAARTRRVMWLSAPPALHLPRSSIVVFMAVEKDGQPYGFVFTYFVLETLLANATANASMSEIAVFGMDGQVVAGKESDQTEFMELNLRTSPVAVPRWFVGQGWGLRMPPLDLRVGRIVAALPLKVVISALRQEIGVVLLVTAALVAMLLAMYRYWNYRFLTRTYERTCRAVEGEILNHLLVQATPVGLCIVLQKDFSIIAANQVVRNMLDRDGAAVRIPPELCTEFKARIAEDSPENRDGAIRQFKFSFAKSDAAPIHTEISYTSAVVNKTQVLFCAIADISDHHEAERLLRQAKEATDAAAKAKLSFFASMSHEIRTPLSSLVGNLELVALGSLSPEQQARVQAMQASASALLHVVNDVLDFSKMDIGEMRLYPEWSSIEDLVVRATIAQAPLANRQGLRLFVIIDRACPRKLWFDPIRITQILNNLLSNALKFTYSGKVVTRVRWVDAALELSVADSGVGIPAEQCEKLFQPFVQGDAQRLTQAHGTGLGLSICAHLCKLMGGRVSLRSTEGVGTRITISLPLKAPEPESGDRRALHGKPAIMCRAGEYREWFDNLYEKSTSVLTYVTGKSPAAAVNACDYLVATDEFEDQEIDAIWKDRTRLIRVTQKGPLVPVIHDDGSFEMSVYGIESFREAVRSIGVRADPARGQASVAADRRVASAPREEKMQVLIAEDNVLNRSLLRDQLLELGAAVLEAVDGEEALDVLRKHRVDIVLTDMDMPRMTGAQLLVAARQLDPSMRIYAVSASASAQDVEQGRARGFTDYLTKPVPLAVLAGILQANAAQEPASGPAAGEDDDDLPPRLPAVPPSYAHVFLRQLDEDIVTLDAACQHRDLRALSRWAHKLAGGLSVLGPSMLLDQCQELRAILEETGDWVADICEFVKLIRVDLIEMRDLHQVSFKT
ncbi:two-component regulatory system sensor kinase [Caballeronia cordobensis]|uniref:Virulence sensor protein BvgS n=1 Tax=Caballeronia cordobensis TaxID=1353886 RepID=A0A158GHJ5_CABCO|nr:hybrid sensor histidine kinase/response regulator [Caballeronia cordobensis]SAL31089.1 two-component regulatory system sensor kinase [Caballeronia cordobensis]